MLIHFILLHVIFSKKSYNGGGQSVTPGLIGNSNSSSNQLTSETGCASSGSTLFKGDFSKAVDKGVWWLDNQVYNGEVQKYTDTSDVLYVKDGNLVINALKDSDGNWTSSRIRTFDAWENFRVDVTYKLDQEVTGAFPAIWMLPQGNSYIWPLDGEIDIMEYNTQFPVRTQQAIHMSAHFGAGALSYHNCNIDVKVFNTLSVEVNDDEIRFYCNGKASGFYKKPFAATVFNWPFNLHKYGLVLNYAINPSFSAKVPKSVNSLSMTISDLTVSKCASPVVSAAKQNINLWSSIVGMIVALFV
ncbi:concanavalin A-like lectin/glucanase domain-containing protein [Globomyces pollinis-pini]|nr:concanavalin A-like lectin/glucanase domain-containing protein [Globomyces pollinis-pini]